MLRSPSWWGLSQATNTKLREIAVRVAAGGPDAQQLLNAQ